MSLRNVLSIALGVAFVISCGKHESRKSTDVAPNTGAPEDAKDNQPPFTNKPSDDIGAAEKAEAEKAEAAKAEAEKAEAAKAEAAKAEAAKAEAEKAEAEKAAADKVMLDLKFSRVESLGTMFVNDVFVDGKTIYVAGDFGIRWSADGGKSWTIKGKKEGLAASIGSTVFASGPNIYVGHPYLTRNLGGLSISNDGGQTWTIKTPDDGLGSLGINDIYASGAMVYAATDGGFSVSNDGGITWTNSIDVGSRKVKSLFVMGETIYAVTDRGVSISPNQGRSWWPNRSPIRGFNDLYYSVYVIDSTVYVGANIGVAKSTDGGHTWTDRSIAIGFGVGESIPPNVGTPMRSVNCVFADGHRVYAATDFGISISSDGGDTWVNKQLDKDFSFILSNVVFVHNNHIYLGTDKGMFEAEF